MARWAIAIVAVLAAGLLVGRPAALDAHAYLVSSTPAANEVVDASPEVIELVFTEPPEPRFSTASLYAADGSLVLEAQLDVVDGQGVVMSFEPPFLEDGTYTVAWRVVSTVDGHATRGSFTFSVGEETEVTEPEIAPEGGPPQALSVFSRWLTFVTTIVLIGLPAMMLFVLGPAIRRAPAQDGTEAQPGRTLARMWWAALIVALLAAVLALLMQAWRFAGGFSGGLDEISGIVSDSRFGHLWLARMVVLGILLYLTLAFDRRLFRGSGSPALWGLLVAGALGVAATSSLGSHAAAGDDYTVTATIADWVHTVAAGAWVGGLLVLLAVASLLLRSGGAEDRTAFLGSVVHRFSVVAIVAMAVIAATGLFGWWVRIGVVEETFQSGYGWSLVAKIVLLLPMAVLGAMNLLVVSPRLRQRASGAAEAARQRWPRLLQRNVFGEALLGVTILAATAFLTDTAPPDMAPPSTTPSGIVQEARAGDLEMELRITPGRPGSNDIELHLDDVQGDEAPVTQVLIRLRYLDEDLGQSEESVEAVSPGLYRVSGTQLGFAGDWEVLVIVQRQGVPDARHAFEVTVAP